MQLKYSYILLLLFLFLACSTSNDKEIYNVVISKKVKPLPPPPLPKPGDTINRISKQTIDSINNVPLKIAVFPFKLDFKIENDDSLFLKNSVPTNINYFESQEKIQYEEIYGRPSLTFKILPKDHFNSKTVFDNYDGTLQLSKIKYNNDDSKAIVIVSYLVGYLSGSTVAYYLEKQNGKWSIKKSKQLTVS